MNTRVSTEGLARACAVHPKRTVGIWLAVVLVSFAVIALLLGDALTTDGDVTSNPESKQAAALIDRSFPPEPTPSEIVIVRSDRYTVDQPAFQAKVQALADRSEALGIVAGAQSYYGSSDPALVSKDGHATMVPLVMRGDEIAPLVELVGTENGRDGFAVSITGVADGRRRLREALRGGSAEGRAADRAAGGADRARCWCSGRSWRGSCRCCSGCCRSWSRSP